VDKIDYFESIILFCLYLIYVLICMYSDRLQQWFGKRFPVFLDVPVGEECVTSRQSAIWLSALAL
jgi:hypothetical protein